MSNDEVEFENKKLRLKNAALAERIQEQENRIADLRVEITLLREDRGMVEEDV